MAKGELLRSTPRGRFGNRLSRKVKSLEETGKPQPIVLIGFMGSGKTTVGKRLAELIGVPFVDTDSLVEERAGVSIAEIFTTKGEQSFRKLETAALAVALQLSAAVISVGGGVPAQPENAPLLAGHTIVYVEVPLEVVKARTEGDTSRPLLLHPDLASLYEARCQTYAAMATVAVDAAVGDAEAVARRIADRLHLVV